MKLPLLHVKVRLFIDEKEVTNFFQNDVQLIEQTSLQSFKLLKRYDDFTGKLTLTRRQAWRLIRFMVKQMVQGRFKVGSK